MKKFIFKIWNFFKRIGSLLYKIFFRKRTSSKEKKTPPKKIPRGLKRELEDLKGKLTNFLVTYSVKNGVVAETNNYKLTKNAPNLYKIEGKERSGRTYSIVISTDDIINSSNGKISGLIRVSEAELNRALQYNYTTLGDFLANFQRLKLSERSLGIVYEKQVQSDWKEILSWKRFWKEQFLLKLSPNVIAVLLAVLDMEFYQFFMDIATEKQKRIVVDELFFLNQQVNSDETNPYTKNLGLVHFESAEDEFKKVYDFIKEKMEKETS
ncbi:MAG: hypothetical protein H7A23_22695 [Leptospiraceae bacterium]|nr:hypothetical protein [Leptospiraceae bacterium]MCP5497373.1 hypothetical protein [Leptospiraceae bacterium]